MASDILGCVDMREVDTEGGFEEVDLRFLSLILYTGLLLAIEAHKHHLDGQEIAK